MLLETTRVFLLNGISFRPTALAGCMSVTEDVHTYRQTDTVTSVAIGGIASRDACCQIIPCNLPISMTKISVQPQQCQTPLHGHRLRTLYSTTNGQAHNNSTTSPPTDKNLPHSNILTCRVVGLWHCNVANLLYNKL